MINSNSFALMFELNHNSKGRAWKFHLTNDSFSKLAFHHTLLPAIVKGTTPGTFPGVKFAPKIGKFGQLTI